MRVGVELGVQKGEFAAHMLAGWPSCTRYYLVDLWAHQDNYKDWANVDTAAQEGNLQKARAKLQTWEPKLVWLRNFTTDAARTMHERVDFVYVDARHDYCGVMEDLQAWWPLLKPGGIIAGHDYEDAHDVQRMTPDQDWSMCTDGSVHKGAVRGAVNEFFSKKGLAVTVMYKESAWNSWIVRKP
jgi:predicted O-methyltransferase YrrM